jgi:HlyD family secretion protein
MIPFDLKLLFKILGLHLKYKKVGKVTWRFVFLLFPLMILNHLFHQFFFLLDEIFFPSYRKIDTDSAMFIVGPPRCGTSLLMELLNHSDDITSMKLWELYVAPSICEKLFWLQIGKIDRFLGGWLSKKYLEINDKILGGFKEVHQTSFFHFEEDAMVFYHSGNSPFFLFFFPFLELKSPLFDFDRSASPEYKARYMKYYKKCIQKHLFVFGKQKRYLSKNPLFSAYILTLKEHFNDARFIFLTRTPYDVVPSTISLATYFKGYTLYVDDSFMVTAILEMLRTQYAYPLDVLDFTDTRHNAMIRFTDLVADPKATVEDLLNRFQIDCTGQMKIALKERARQVTNYVSRNTYSFGKYNIREAQFKAYFSKINAAFGFEEREIAQQDHRAMESDEAAQQHPDAKSKEEIRRTLKLDRNDRKNNSTKRRAMPVLVFLLFLVAAVVIFSWGEKPEAQYQTETIERGDITIIVHATGNLAPTNKVQVGCELSGIVKEVAVDFNDRVEIGQPLARLDDTKFKAAVMKSRAALESAKAKHLQARTSWQLKKQNLKRLRQLHRSSGGKLPTAQDLEVAKTEMECAKAEESAAKAAIEQAEARLKIDETNLEKTTILSPINGIVLNRNVDPGQTVAASLQAPVLFSLARDLTKMGLQVDVDEADVGLVKQGQFAEFTVEAFIDRVFTARITKIRYEPQITNGVVTYTSLLNVKNPDRVLRPGMTATVAIFAKEISDTIKVPNAALRFAPSQAVDRSPGWRGLFDRFSGKLNADDYREETQRQKIGYTQVWCLIQGELTPLTIRTGLSDGLYTAVTDGDLEPGMQVVMEEIAAD